MSTIRSAASLKKAVEQTCAKTTITDIHTHLFPPSHGGLLLWGIDEMLGYHYLVSELFMVAPRELTPQIFAAMPRARQADLVWEHLFLKRTPISEAARGVLLTLKLLGIDPGQRDLKKIRAQLAGMKIEKHLPEIFQLAGLDSAIMTNDPFNAEEVSYLQRKLPVPACLKTALRIDPLLNDFAQAAEQMKAQGYRLPAGNRGRYDVARRFLVDWANQLKPVYMAASMSNDFAYPADDARAELLDRVVLPVAKELGLPLALMIGVKRQVNPALKIAGDAGGVADVSCVQHLAAGHPDVKFLFTFISRVNQHELCILARLFGNVHVFGCWWYSNQGSIIAEIMRMRLEMLGTAFTAQHSDARVLDQLLYKWAEARRILSDVLSEKYLELFNTGWRPSVQEIQRDVRRLFGGSFQEFLAK